MAGQFCWVELLTKGVDAAQVFYGHVLGWTFTAPGHSDHDYRVISAGGRGMGGMMELPAAAEAMGARPAWMGYIYSDDVDAAVERLLADDGKILRPAETLPGIGRFAIVTDPQGAVFVLFTDLSGKKPEEEPHALEKHAGNVGWHELYAEDLDSAFAFYAKHFGWTKAEAFDMGPMGVYQLFATGGLAVGGMMRRPPTVPQPFWVYYFTVPALDAALARVTEGGGHILNGPQQVPGDLWIAQCLDPQGAFFALLADKR